MDSITQIALGTAIGGATAGKQTGNRALLWGGILGVVPDLDVFITPFFSEEQALTIHRGFSHSIVFTLLASPLFGWLIYRYLDKKSSTASLSRWMLLAFLVIATHILLDTFTNYGTQVFQPFSNYPAAFSSIFIIDPLYTLPLLVGITLAAFHKKLPKPGFSANKWGLIISTTYLALTLFAKAYVHNQFQEGLQKQDITYERLMTTPTPFNIFLWTGYADNGETIHAGLFSIFDSEAPSEFQKVDKNRHLIQDSFNSEAVQTAIWFSRGYYTVTKDPKTDRLIFHDLKFGRSDLWLTSSATYSWSYKFIQDANSGKIVGFERTDPSFSGNSELMSMFWERIKGNSYTNRTSKAMLERNNR